MRSIILAIIIFLVDGCIPEMSPVPNIVKSIKIGDTQIEWLSFSTSYAEVPDCILIKNDKRIDTLCKSNNIAEIKDIDNQKILIGFYGVPKLYDKVIEIPFRLSDFTLIVDTSYRYKTKQQKE